MADGCRARVILLVGRQVRDAWVSCSCRSPGCRSAASLLSVAKSLRADAPGPWLVAASPEVAVVANHDLAPAIMQLLPAVNDVVAAHGAEAVVLTVPSLTGATVPPWGWLPPPSI